MERWEKIRRLKALAPLLSVVVVGACMMGTLAGYEPPVYASQQPIPAPAETVQKDEPEEAQGSFELEDGVYEGTGTGFAGEVKAAVTIKDKKIVSIDILQTSDDAAFFNRAKAVIDRIIAGQTLEVDTVSGATYSSKGIIHAVKHALTGEKDSGQTGNSITGAGASSQSLPAIGTVQDAAAYKDGTYYGTGTGFAGELKVKVIISGGKIASIQIIETKDGSSYIQKASALMTQIVERQSTNVDTVSGATYSSAGIIQAVRGALSQAAVSREQSAQNQGQDVQNQGQNSQNQEQSPAPPDTQLLERLIKQAEALDGSLYTELSWAILHLRLQDAKEALEMTEQAVIDLARRRLLVAIAGLAIDPDKGEELQTVYRDGSYEAAVLCSPDEDEEFTPYQLSLKMTLRNDRIIEITDVRGDGESTNDRFIERAVNGTSTVEGVVAQILLKGMPEEIDTVTRATCSSNAIIEACRLALEQAKYPVEGTTEETAQ